MTESSLEKVALTSRDREGSLRLPRTAYALLGSRLVLLSGYDTLGVESTTSCGMPGAGARKTRQWAYSRM